MAQKKPLCLYEGKTKQLQPGDTLIGAYNATEAGWTVNASGWLVATPGCYAGRDGCQEEEV